MVAPALPTSKSTEINPGDPYFAGGMIRFKNVHFPKLDQIADDVLDATSLLKMSLAEIPDFEAKKQAMLDALPIEQRGSARDFFVKIYNVTAPEALLSTTPEAREAVESFLKTLVPNALQQLKDTTQALLVAGSELHQMQLDVLRGRESIPGPGMDIPENYAAAIDRFSQRGERLGYAQGAGRF